MCPPFLLNIVAINMGTYKLPRATYYIENIYIEREKERWMMIILVVVHQMEDFMAIRLPQPTPAPFPATGISMGLPAHLNQAIASNAEDSECTIREQDRFLPIANVIRIMRRILPPHAKISDESKVIIQEYVSEFISFITGEANDRCKREQRKTITAEDLLWAMNKLGFDDYIEPLTLYLHRYREFDGGERGSLRGEPFLLKRPMVDPTSGCNIMPYHLPPNFPMAHHHGYFVYPPPIGDGYMQGEASNGSTSQCTVAAADSDIESPVEEGKD